ARPVAGPDCRPPHGDRKCRRDLGCKCLAGVARSVRRGRRRGPPQIGVCRDLNGEKYASQMEFRRINGLPPYVFAHIDALKLGARRAGRDVIDLGFGNPDIASPEVAVEKLAEAVRNPRNHRYSASRGIPKLRQAVSALYMRRFGVEIDPDTEAV